MNDDKRRTMRYLGLDGWSRPVYRCLETKMLWKDVNLGKGEPCLCSCNNEFEGEPDSPIHEKFIIDFVGGPSDPFRGIVVDDEFWKKREAEDRAEFIKRYGREPKEGESFMLIK